MTDITGQRLAVAFNELLLIAELTMIRQTQNVSVQLPEQMEELL